MTTTVARCIRDSSDVPGQGKSGAGTGIPADGPAVTRISPVAHVCPGYDEAGVIMVDSGRRRPDR
ncbi:hypothetical protein GCM10022223_66560 [Kineosporia mesophila]|uniref:Uncharacterized protein n=1 Tax=Kineosporia mesophila TaxID=566012 RepID=A0ABP7AQE9_9ACTN